MSETPTPEIQTRREALPLAGRQMELRGYQRSQADSSAPESSPLATAQIVFTTGAGVKCYDWYRDRAYVEELVVEEGAILTVCEGITGKDVVPGKTYTPAECDALRDKHLKILASAG